MPIYAYRCTACGHAKDVLQKMSDPLLSTCPACGAETFTKQVTAAGFQLKGSGWYVTDFKGGGAAPASTAVPPKAGDAAAAPAPASPDGKGDSKSASSKSDSASSGKGDSASPATAPPAAPTGGSGAGH
jgi:putative FmdB family regulatory protein